MYEHFEICSLTSGNFCLSTAEISRLHRSFRVRYKRNMTCQYETHQYELGKEKSAIIETQPVESCRISAAGLGVADTFWLG